MQASTDKVPPAAPTGLTAELSGKESVLLKWNPNTEEDLAGYLVFKSQTIKATHITYSEILSAERIENEISLPAIESGAHYFVLKAFDYLGNESAYSKSARIVKE
ncbi:MAG: fibronectin type III domain-containing protein [Candidatus Diapherotrites archaeon]|nr:fibronectin type III domain-containing protein [Candidatus Diapherotrites archaeon]